MEIRAATTADLDSLAPLFDAYRVFYQAQSDLEGARRFLGDRLGKGESRVFMAWDGGQAVGFTQLYPSFSSVSMKRLWILNDLFVAPRARASGVGEALMRMAEEFARADGAKGLSLATQSGNLKARSLYGRMGYKLDEEFFHFHRVF
jgi:GNAT superfamily N-acetyltransferase